MVLSTGKLIELKNDNKRKKSFYITVIFQFLIFSLLSNAFINENQQLLLLVIIGTIIYSLFARIEWVFSMVLGLSIYDYSFNINGANATLIITGILILRLLNKNKFILVKSRNSMIALIAILFCEIVGDINYISIGEVVLTLVNVSLFLYLILNLDILDVDLFEMILLFFIVVSCAIYCMLSTYGTLGSFFNLLFTSSGLYRFGIGNANVMGGAMSLPLYALLLLSMTLTYVLTDKKIGVAKGIFLLIINVVCLFFAFLTISRSLFLGLLAIFLAILLGKKRCKESILMKLFIVIIVAFAIGIFLYGEIIEQAFSLLFYRLSTDVGGAGRSTVWEKCFNYLLEHPSGLVIGYGSCKYPTLENGLGAGAHNFILDIIMSWGIVGLISVITLFIRALNKIKKNYRVDSMAYIPLWAISAFALTALRSNSLKAWSFFLVTILVVQCVSRKGEKKDDT